MSRPAEAAFVVRVAVRDVNRMIGERILPDGSFTLEDDGRACGGACTLIALYFASAKQLTAEERLVDIEGAGARLRQS